MRFCGECGAKVDAPAKQNDDPWADVLDEQKSDDPWANFADSQQQEEEIEQEPQVDLQKINDDYNKGVDLYWKQQFSDALPLLLPAAQQGNAEAQAQVGYCHFCMQKYDEAYQWFCKASAQGVVWAYDNIGWMYQNGLGVKQDYFLAYSNYKTAADLGSAFSCANAGWLLQNGWGVQQDYNKAFDYFLKAAEMNHAGAQNSVGWFYHKGIGIDADCIKAIEWYQKAISNGENQYAPANLFDVAKYSAWCGKKKEKQAGFEVLLTMAQQGNVSAQKEVANCYYAGLGTAINYHQAGEWAKRAIQGGDQDSLKILHDVGYGFFWGIGTEENLSKGLEFFTFVAENGHARSYATIAYAYAQGKGVKKDLKKAKELYKKVLSAFPNDDYFIKCLDEVEKELKK